jgi:diphthamide synthase (EF-2-diphthine--ammonia ligase)
VKPVLMSWSGGKDSCLALYEIQKSSSYRVAALLTTITRNMTVIPLSGSSESSQGRAFFIAKLFDAYIGHPQSVLRQLTTRIR